MAYKFKKNQDENEENIEQGTIISGNEFFAGMRFTISGILFEITSRNRILCVESHTDLPDKIHNAIPGIGEKHFNKLFSELLNTVWDISGNNYFEFFRYTGLEANVKKCIPAGNRVDSQKVYDMLNEADLNWTPDELQEVFRKSKEDCINAKWEVEHEGKIIEITPRIGSTILQANKEIMENSQ